MGFSMKKLLILSLCCFQTLFADPSLDGYFSYIQQLEQPYGNSQEGEITVVVDPAEILRIQKVQENRLLKKGFSEEEAKEFSRVGIVSEDQYWIWLRDAVYFPNQVPGTYDRLIWKSSLQSKSPGIAVLPVLPSGRFVLNLNYRHATRSWELELPRGMMNSGETFEQAAKREVKEETGFIVSSLMSLGKVAPDSGALSSVVPVFMAKISKQEASSPEYSEAIAGILSFTKEELREGLIQGFLEVQIDGKKQKAALRDSFLTFALLQAELRNLLQ